jgi:hypothetical protein
MNVEIRTEAAQFSYRGINKSDFPCSAATKKTVKYLEGEPDVVQSEVVRLEAEEDG